MNKDKRYAMFERFQSLNPHPVTELCYHSPFELLVAVILSAQATDTSVNKATKTLFAVANTPAAILALGESGLKTHIKTIGLFNSKARHILQTCQLLLAHHQGHVPCTREALEALPGVGRKTANVVLNSAFGKPTIPVDTHVFRVANRTAIAKAKTPLAVELLLLKRIPKPFLQHAHHWLVLHGRYVCLAKKPRCGACPIRQWCEYPNKTS